MPGTRRVLLVDDDAMLREILPHTRGMIVSVGLPVFYQNAVFNAAAVLHDGVRVGVYHKQYLPNYGVFDENRYFQAGTETPVFVAGDTTFAVNVCEDIWYPAGPTAGQALGGAELVVNINGSPYHVGKARLREQLVSTRAVDDLVCVAYVNTVGGQIVNPAVADALGRECAPLADALAR